MCRALIISTSNEIQSSTIAEFKNESIYISKVCEENILSLFNNKDNVYMITDGMCSCDFFQRRGNRRVFEKNVSLLRELIKILYDEGNFIKVHVHEYRGKYEEENLPKPCKEKIGLMSLIDVIDDIREDTLYIIY